MVLVDTSVLIPFLKGVESEFVLKFENLIINQIPFGINNYIYFELLQGVSNDKDFHKLRTYLIEQKFYHFKNGIKSFEDASKIYSKCRKSGITIRSSIDTLIAQTAIDNNLILLHNDKDFDNISQIIPELICY